MKSKKTGPEKQQERDPKNDQNIGITGISNV